MQVMISWLFYADTPLQIYNATLLASSLKQSSVCIDLIVYDQFSEAKKLIESYKKLNIFDAIYLIEKIEAKEVRDYFIWEICACFGRKTIDFSQYISNSYNNFALACPTFATFELLTFLRKYNPSLNVVFYEDGTGSYNGNVFQQIYYFDKPPTKAVNTEWFVRTIRNIIVLPFFKKFQYSPSTLYLKRPELIQFPASIAVKPLLPSAECINQLLSDSSLNSSDIDSANNIIILDTPRISKYGITPETKAIDLAVRIIKKISSNRILFRAHPRSNIAPEWLHTTNCSDCSNGLWELICRTEEIITGESLLVSSSSTAQLSPVIEANKKPYLLFLYKLAFTPDQSGYSLGEAISRMACQAYLSDKNKILIPNSPKELEEILVTYALQSNSPS